MSGKQIVTQASRPIYPHFIWVLVSQDLLSHINVSMVSFLQSLLLLFHFCLFLSQLSELVWKLAEEIDLQSAPKRFPSFGPPANGNKSNSKKSRFRPNRNLTGTIYHWSVILRSFSVVLNSAIVMQTVFQGSPTLLASFDFSTSCPKIKVWCTTCISCDFWEGIGASFKRHVRGRWKKALKFYGIYIEIKQLGHNVITSQHPISEASMGKFNV